MGEFGDSLGKKAVRELWDTPLLKYLHQTYNLRFRYMGLPGVDLLDVKLWKDMIDEVIAFEIRAEPNDDDPLGRRYITELRRNLQLLGIPGYAYFGSIEEVVNRREDYEGTKYSQNNFIPLYNLDFCDEIASKIATAHSGEIVLRFQVIRQILADQQECYKRFGGLGIFLILLTVRNQLGARKLRSFLSKNLYSDTQNYVEVCNRLSNLPLKGSVIGTHTWALKAFLHNTIRQYLSNPNISATFFPMVKYTGKTPGSPMIHCMILCRFEDPQVHSPLYLPQNYLTEIPSVRALDTQDLIWEPEPGERMGANAAPNSQQWLRDLTPTMLSGMELSITKVQL